MRDEIASFVNHCLVNMDRQDSGFDRRREQRYSFPVLISIQPTNPKTLLALGDSLLVVGKHISVSGLGFFHHRPLTHSHYIISVVHDISSETGLLWKARWCRFLGDQWYESGGQFVKIA